MTVLITSINGQCDARCYDGRGQECDCVCGGRNHGVGFERASGQQRLFFSRISERLSVMQRAISASKKLLGASL